MSKKKNKKKINVFSKIIAGLFALTLISFIGFIVTLNVIPVKYFSIIMIVLVVLFLIIESLLIIPKIKSKIKIGTSVFAIILAIIFLVGDSYMLNTLNFLDKITGAKDQVENYYLVVLDNGTFNKTKDLNGYKMGIFTSNSETYDAARKKIVAKVDTENKDYTDFVSLGNDLLDEDVDAIFISESYKSMIEDEIESFKGKTKILDTISINIEKKDIAKEVDVLEEPFNIFVSGIDTYGKIQSISRSDVNMIVTVNPNTHQILLTSIPRDYYVQLHGKTGLRDKLTHAGIYGVDTSVSTIEDLFKTDINYYVRVNFTTLIDLVDVIDGINVYSDATFIPWTNSSLTINKGNVHMNGDMALAFSRERHAYASGDRHRVQNQQDVITAIMKKVLSSKTIITKYNGLLKTLDGSFQTNMKTNNLTSLIKKQINSMPSWTITSQSVNGSDSSNYTYSYSGQKLYVMEPDMSTVTAATKKINSILGK